MSANWKFQFNSHTALKTLEREGKGSNDDLPGTKDPTLLWCVPVA